MWVIDLILNTATHLENGAVIRFEKDTREAGYWDGELLVMPHDTKLDASYFAKLMREAGDAFMAERANVAQ